MLVAMAGDTPPEAGGVSVNHLVRQCRRRQPDQSAEILVNHDQAAGRIEADGPITIASLCAGQPSNSDA